MELEEICRDHISGLTVVTGDRLTSLYRLSRYAARLPGAMAEVGVYKGGTSILLARANPGKQVHAFDTFAGIPNAIAGADDHSNGDFNDLDAEATIKRLRDADVIVHQGYFPSTADPKAGPFCFVHFDGDTYQTCVDFLAYFWPRMTVGGMMVFDDYKWYRCLGVEKAIVEHSGKFGCIPLIAEGTSCQAIITVCR